MELLFTKNSYSHGRGIEKANQIHAVQKLEQQMGKVKAVKELVVQGRKQETLPALQS